MSYQAFARKYRPRNFAELVGQQHVVSAISNGLSNSRVHHAYLFSGTRGVGKTTIARIFAKSLNCEEGTTAQPCGTCQSCVDIDQGRYVDLLEIDAASRTKVEDTRELLDNVQYRPTRGRYKVYLIDEVHMLSKHSFNALLKTLEEPPEHVKFLLATTDPQKLPITVLSRCLQFNLKALTVDQIEHQLTHVLHEDGIAFEPPAVSALARSARGSMRDALSLLDQAVASGNNHVSMSVVKDMLGLVDHSVSIQLFRSICARDKATAFDLLHAMYQESLTLESILDDVIAVCYQVALTQMVPEVCKLETEHARGIFELAKQISAEHIQLLYQIGLHGKKDFPYAPDPKVGLEMTLLRMLAFAPQPPKEFVQDSSAIEEHISKKNTEFSALTQTPAANEAALAEPVTAQPATPAPGKSPVEQPEQSSSNSTSPLPKQDTEIQTAPHEVKAPYDVNKDEQFKRTVAAISLRSKLAGPKPKAVIEQGLSATNLDAMDGEIINPTNSSMSTPTVAYGMMTSSQVQHEGIAPEPSWSDQPFFDEELSSEQALRDEQATDELSIEQAPPFIYEVQNQRPEPTAAVFDTTNLPARIAQFSSVDALEPEQSGLERVIKVAADIDPWCALIESMKPVGKLRNFLMNSVPVGLSDGVLCLLTADEQDSLFDERLRADTCSALSKAGFNISALTVEFAEHLVTPLTLDSRIKQLLIERAQRLFDRDPKLSCLKQQFGTQVIEDTLVIK